MYLEKNRKVINCYKHDAFKNKNLNLMNGEFIKSWFHTSKIKTFDRMDFLPYPRICPPNIYNSFTGIRCDNIENYNQANFDIILNHIKLLVGVDELTDKDYNKDGYEYLLNYLSHLFQKLGEIPEVAMVFKGKQGSGKSLFWNLIGSEMLGEEFILETAEMEKVIGRFNLNINKFLVVLDEAQGKESFTNSDRIKHMITQPTLAWEQKGIQGLTISNCGRYIFLTNNDTPIKIEMSDRRFVVFEMNNAMLCNREYFAKLVKSFKNTDIMMSFYNFLMSRDIKNWDAIRDRPETKIYKELQAVNIPIYAHFLMNWCIVNCDKEMDDYTGMEFYYLFKTYLEQTGRTRLTIDISSFGRYIKKYAGVDYKRTNKSATYTLNRDEIIKGLEEKNLV